MYTRCVGNAKRRGIILYVTIVVSEVFAQGTFKFDKKLHLEVDWLEASSEWFQTTRETVNRKWDTQAYKIDQSQKHSNSVLKRNQKIM